jgi:hypothetical protein
LHPHAEEQEYVEQRQLQAETAGGHRGLAGWTGGLNQTFTSFYNIARLVRLRPEHVPPKCAHFGDKNMPR